MQGDHEVGGVKILLYDRSSHVDHRVHSIDWQEGAELDIRHFGKSEISVNDLGDSIPSGMHTFLALSINQVCVSVPSDVFICAPTCVCVCMCVRGCVYGCIHCYTILLIICYDMNE